MLHEKKTVAYLMFLALLAAAPHGASAEESPAASVPTGSGQPTIERLPSGFVIAPDVRFADVDGRFGNFVGGYGGWMTDRTLLIGIGGYWLTNGQDGFEMAYGGGVVEWTFFSDRRVALSARALIGGGGATVVDTLANLGYRTDDGGPVDPRFPEPNGGRHGFFPPRGRPLPGDTRVRFHEDFFVAEPQVNASVRLAGWLRLGAGVGYRLIGSANQLNDRLRGVSGTVSLQIGGGS
jgi:hypothetical protein